MKNNNNAAYDLLVIGELNMDLILNRVESFPELGKEKIARDFHLTMGSSSAIFAANSSRLGLSVEFCGMVGKDDFGDKIIRQLQEYGIDTHLVNMDENQRTGLTVIVRYNNDRAMITYPGAMENFTLSDISSEVWSSARHVHISSIFLQPGIKKDLIGIIEAAKSCNMTVSVDPQWDPDEKWDLDFKKLVSTVDFFFPNEDEFLKITETSDVEAGIRKFQPHLKSGTIIIKQGPEGATFCTAGETGKIPGYINEQPQDTVGAGDSFDAGFIYRFLKGYPIRDCVRFGNITGAVSTTEAGGTEAIKSIEHVSGIAKNKFSIDDITG